MGIWVEMWKVELKSKLFSRFGNIITLTNCHISFNVAALLPKSHLMEAKLAFTYFWKPGIIFRSIELKIIEYMYLYIPTISGAKIDTLEDLIHLAKCMVNFFEDFQRAK